VIRIALPLLAPALLAACSSDSGTDVPPLPKETAETANQLMAGAVNAASEAAARKETEPKRAPEGSSATTNEVTP
jgi:hypothetical protein